MFRITPRYWLLPNDNLFFSTSFRKWFDFLFCFVVLLMWRRRRWGDEMRFCHRFLLHLRNLIKWLWEFLYRCGETLKRNIFIWFRERAGNLQAVHRNEKLVWKSTSISEAWECVALKWHANQFDGIQIVSISVEESRVVYCNLCEMLANMCVLKGRRVLNIAIFLCLTMLCAFEWEKFSNGKAIEWQRDIKCYDV